MTKGTRSRTSRRSSAVSPPWSWAPFRPVRPTMSITRSGVSLRKTPMVSVSWGRRLMTSRTTSGWTCRGLGANTKPMASAPMATASSASSSLVTPQILTNTVSSDVGELAVQVGVVGAEVEQAVAGVVEQDDPLLPRFLGRQRFVDGGPDGVRGLRGGDRPLGAGELGGGFEHLALRVGDGLHPAVLDQVADDRGVAVVAEPAGVDRRRDELVAQRVHEDLRRHAGLVAEVVLVTALRQRRAGRWLDRHQPGAAPVIGPGAVGDERQRQPGEVGAAAAGADHHVGQALTGLLQLLLGLEADDRLVEQHVVENRAQRVVGVGVGGGVLHRVADGNAE